MTRFHRLLSAAVLASLLPSAVPATARAQDTAYDNSYPPSSGLVISDVDGSAITPAWRPGPDVIRGASTVLTIPPQTSGRVRKALGALDVVGRVLELRDDLNEIEVLWQRGKITAEQRDRAQGIVLAGKAGGYIGEISGEAAGGIAGGYFGPNGVIVGGTLGGIGGGIVGEAGGRTATGTFEGPTRWVSSTIRSMYVGLSYHLGF